MFCVDPKYLYAALRREQYRLQVLDDILVKLNQALFLTKVNLSSAFWQLMLDEKSSLLTAFTALFGRLPFELEESCKIFQKRLVQALDNLECVICVADEVLVYGGTPGEHDKHLENFLERRLQQRICLIAENFDYGVTTVAFFRTHPDR